MRIGRRIGVVAALLLGTIVGNCVGADESKVDPAALQRWQDMRFGMFIHWGPVSVVHRSNSLSYGSKTKASNVFNKITAQHVRLNILQATDGPTLWEVQLFGPK